VMTRDGRRAEVTLPRGPAGASPVAVRLSPLPARLSGKVVENGSRKPVAGALVWPSDDPAAFVLTDAKGAYTIKAPAGDAPRVDGAAAGYLPAMETARAAAGPTLSLKPLATVSGSVVDAAGRPVAEAVIRAVTEGGGARAGRGSASSAGLVTRSGPQGLFQLRVVPGHPVTLVASHPDFTQAKLPLPELAARASRTNLRIVLEKGLSGFGKVVDAAGRPVSGAEVALIPSGEERDPFARAFMMDNPPAGPQAFTDAQGSFLLEHLEPGRFSLHTSARGFAPVTVPGIQLAAGQPRVDLGTVTLAPGATLEGVVVDPRDRPIAGAQVGVRAVTRTARHIAEPEEDILTSADGSFSIPDLKPGEKVMLFVSKLGYVRATFNGIEVPPVTPLRVVLTPGVRVAGRVVDEGGDPVAGASVRLTPAGTTMVTSRGPMESMRGFAVSETDGRFAIEGVEAGKVRLVATAQGFLEGEVPGFDVVTGRDIDDLEVVLRRGSVVTGRVTGPDGAPVSGARVQMVEEAGRGSYRMGGSASSDGDGNYRLEGVPEGAHSFAAQGEGLQRAVRDLEVRTGENRLDFRLEGGHEVSGRVVDSSGQPAAGAMVRLSSTGDRIPTMSRSGRPEARSGADGSFRISGVATGVYDVAADKEGYAPAQLESVNVTGRVQGLELRLEAGGGIQGRLLGLDFSELAGASVYANPAEPALARTVMRLARAGQVDYQGQYRISGLTAGEWRVSARTDSGRQAEGKVTVTPGAEATLDLELGGGFTLTGRVLRGGEGVPNIDVLMHGTGEGGGSGRASTDPQGAFRIQGLKPGTYQLQAMSFRTGLSHNEAMEISGDRDILIELPTRRVSGRVVDATDQSPIANVVVSLEPADGAEIRSGFGKGSRTDADGAFTISEVAPGSYRVNARLDGYAPAESPVQVDNDDDVDGVRLALQPTQGLTLEVRSSLGTPPSEVRVALLDPSGRSVLSGTHTTGENGRARVSSAPPGRWRLLVASGASATTALDVQVPGPPIPVVLAPGGMLTVLAGGMPTGTIISLVGSGGQPFQSLMFGGGVRSQWSLNEGAVVIEGVPPGQWRVRATTLDGQAREGTASVSSGGASQVTLR